MSTSPFNIPPIVTEPKQVARKLIVPSVVREVSDLVQYFGLQNVQITKPSKSNFTIPQDGLVRDPGIGMSSLGTLVLVDLTFHGQTYKNEVGKTITFPDILLQTVLLSINQTKEIVKTKVQGRKGTVKEYIGLGDYEISISAIITGANGVYPRTDVQNLIYMAECPNQITVTSWYLDMFFINSIVIDDYDINQDEGGYSRQPISITASSDEAANLRFL